MKSVKLAVEVRAEDIKRGVRFRSQECPLYFAIDRALSHAEFPRYPIWTHLHTLVVLVKKGREDMYDQFKSIPLPYVARKFSQDFDNGRKVRPFQFVMPMTGTISV